MLYLRVFPLPYLTVACKGVAPVCTVWNTLIDTLSSTCPGTFSSGAGTWSGLMNLLPSTTMSSAAVPLAVVYALSMTLKDPPLILVSSMLASVIFTVPSLSIGRKISVSPAFTGMN